MELKRADLVLVEQGKARSRTEAQKLILQGLVAVYQTGLWQPLAKTSVKIPADAKLQVGISEEQRYVSRAGLKLEAALKNLCTPATHWLALDVGQSTGGFTDCLLQHGVAHVIGLEVGHGQLAQSLCNDSRITLLENYNARHLCLADLPERAQAGVDIVVMDVSFISQHLILPNLPGVLKKEGWLISLVKPQFELNRNDIGKNGIVKNAASYLGVEARFREHLQALGFTILNYQESPIQGGDGNREFLITAQYKGCDRVTN